MRETLTQLYVHFIWGTWDRAPLLTTARQQACFACVQAKCTELGAEMLTIGGVVDHVHVLVRYPATLAVATLAKEIKGASSHLVTHELEKSPGFKWQGGYAAFAVSRWDVPRIRHYILNQELHHGDGTVQPDLEWQ
jgi:putative transposase